MATSVGGVRVGTVAIATRPPSTAPGRIRYQPALDGLRAVAVAAVVLYHGGVGATPGGFLGVDAFFVLSGYLITTLLLAEWGRTHRIDLGAFYGRRARRLLPALLLVLAAVAAYAALLAEPIERARLRGDGIASLLYVANWRFVLSGESYFEQFAAPSPLRHLWSLAIEEQWYLLWPVVLAVLLAAFGRRRLPLAAAMLGAAAVSAGLMAVVADPTTDPSRAYYGTDTRAQALLVGSALAVALDRRGPLQGAARAAVELAGLAGAVTFVAMVLTVDDTDPGMYRGGFALVAVACAAVVAAAVQPRAGAVRRALSRPALVALGRISYGVYLWHWPVDVVLSPDRVGVRGLPLLAVRLAVTLAAARLSYRLVEAPIRSGALRGRAARPVTVAAVATVAALLVVSTAGAVEGPTAASPGPPPPSTTAVPQATRVLLVGDSVAFTLGWWFRAERVDEPITIDLQANLGCGVVRGDTVTGGRTVAQHADCATWPDRWQAAVGEFRPDVAVVLVGAWEVLDHVVDGELLEVGTPEYERYLRDELDRGLDLLVAGGQPVALLTVPCYDERDPELGGDASERNDPERVAEVNRVLRAAAAERAGAVTLVDLGGHLCPGGEYQPEMDGVALHVDGVHYTEDGAALVWQWLAPRLRELVAVGAHDP